MTKFEVIYCYFAKTLQIKETHWLNHKDPTHTQTRNILLRLSLQKSETCYGMLSHGGRSNTAIFCQRCSLQHWLCVDETKLKTKQHCASSGVQEESTLYPMPGKNKTLLTHKRSPKLLRLWYENFFHIQGKPPPWWWMKCGSEMKASQAGTRQPTNIRSWVNFKLLSEILLFRLIFLVICVNINIIGSIRGRILVRRGAMYAGRYTIQEGNASKMKQMLSEMYGKIERFITLMKEVYFY